VIRRFLTLLLVGGLLFFAASLLHIISFAYLVGVASGLALALIIARRKPKQAS
jgi:membrane associated rhomboid family serine protease